LECLFHFALSKAIHMKMGVVGCGALGSFYGAKLCRSGHSVHFLLRSDYEVVRRQGVQIQSIDGDFSVHPHCTREPDEIGPCDIVFIGLKTTANTEFIRLLPPLLTPQTAIVTFQNGLGNVERLAELFGPERILGGLCFVCLNRMAPGVVQHSAHGDIILGEFDRPAQPRTEQLADWLRQAKVACQVTDNLAKAHWEKLVWNIPFNGLGVASVAGYPAVRSGDMPTGMVLGPCLDTQRLLSDPRWLQLVRELMAEVVAAANAQGFPIPESVIEHRIERTRQMGAYKASTLIDYERGQPLELDGLFLEPLRRARAAGLAMPRLGALCQVLSRLNDP
jgi:2-dehydropantoate 2-reductase